jgi:hypothetical protein
MRVTLVGALAIAGAIVLLVLLARYLRDQSPEDGSNS